MVGPMHILQSHTPSKPPAEGHTHSSLWVWKKSKLKRLETSGGRTLATNISNEDGIQLAQ